MVIRNFVFFVLLVTQVDCYCAPLGRFFFGKPSTRSIRLSWRDNFSFSRVRKKLSKRQLIKRNIYTSKPISAYQSALYDRDKRTKVAYIIYSCDKEAHEAIICILYCDKEMRKKGCGSYLLLKAIDHLKKKKMSKITLEACPFENISNEKEKNKLVKFYSKFGFHVTTNEQIGVTMELILDPPVQNVQ